MSVERDALERIDALGMPWYVTRSWALAAYAEPRMTRDIDVVLDATRSDYESVLRPSFESEFLVNDPSGSSRWKT